MLQKIFSAQNHCYCSKGGREGGREEKEGERRDEKDSNAME